MFSGDSEESDPKPLCWQRIVHPVFPRPILEWQIRIPTVDVAAVLTLPGCTFKRRLRVEQRRADLDIIEFRAFDANEPNPRIVERNPFDPFQASSMYRLPSGH